MCKKYTIILNIPDEILRMDLFFLVTHWLTITDKAEMSTMMKEQLFLKRIKIASTILLFKSFFPLRFFFAQLITTKNCIFHEFFLFPFFFTLISKSQQLSKGS